jgi:hypothetical protein
MSFDLVAVAVVGEHGRDHFPVLGVRAAHTRVCVRADGRRVEGRLPRGRRYAGRDDGGGHGERRREHHAGRSTHTGNGAGGTVHRGGDGGFGRFRREGVDVSLGARDKMIKIV